MDRYPLGGNPSFVSEASMNQEMDFEMSSPGAYSDTLNSQLNSHGQPVYIDYGPYAFPLPLSPHQPSVDFEYQIQCSHQRHISTSTQSTNSSAYRSSSGSELSQWHPRSSTASSNTTWSHFSDHAREQSIASAEYALDAPFSYAPSPLPAVAEVPITSSPSKHAPARQPVQDREPFQTCVSRPKRSRRSQKEPRFWCTACKEGFGEKYDWKRHEETYQERNEKYDCGLCKNVYFLDKDFTKHHRETHRCQICFGRQHVDAAKKKRRARTGWGCGFCSHFSNDWAERCTHVGRHFEGGATMATWNHSQVIFSLLQRPQLIVAWCTLLEHKQSTKCPFSWKQQTTGRVDGYPEANIQPQLQDLLEYFTPDQDAASLVRLAFEKGQVEKALPPPPARPAVPEKDYRSHNARQFAAPLPPHPQHAPPLPAPSIFQNPIDEVPPWNTFLSTIPEDANIATNVCDYDAIAAAFDDLPRHFDHY